jgi:hypothetical protein
MILLRKETREVSEISKKKFVGNTRKKETIWEI